MRKCDALLRIICAGANSGKEKRVKTMPNERPNKYKKITLKGIALTHI
jgi:hypothetical protein